MLVLCLDNLVLRVEHDVHLVHHTVSRLRNQLVAVLEEPKSMYAVLHLAYGRSRLPEVDSCWEHGERAKQGKLHLHRGKVPHGQTGEAEVLPQMHASPEFSGFVRAALKHQAEGSVAGKVVEL